VGLLIPDFIYINSMMIKYNVLDILLGKLTFQWAYKYLILYVLAV
jgi:hypothetical protein